MRSPLGETVRVAESIDCSTVSRDGTTITARQYPRHAAEVVAELRERGLLRRETMTRNAWWRAVVARAGTRSWEG